MSSHVTRPPTGGSFYRNLPGWLQWLIPFAVAAVLMVALIAIVDHKNNSPSEAAVNSNKALLEQQREADVLIGQQQAPHTATLASGTAPLAGLNAAVVAYMHHQVATSTIVGPITSSKCVTRPAATSGTRQAFHCSVVAASVIYPFFGVVDTAQRQVTFCRFVPAPVSGMNIPVSARCR